MTWPRALPIGPVPPRGWGAIVLGAATALWLVVRWTLIPATVDPADVQPADAVVVFAGAPERLTAAVALMSATGAEVLVIPNGTVDGWTEANRLCAEGATDATGRPYEVLCPVPDPVTTRGEARAIAGLAEERAWRSVVAVTSSYHIARAELLLERCFAGHIQPIGVRPELGRSQWWRLARHELAGHLAYRLLFRGC